MKKLPINITFQKDRFIDQVQALHSNKVYEVNISHRIDADAYSVEEKSAKVLRFLPTLGSLDSVKVADLIHEMSNLEELYMAPVNFASPFSRMPNYDVRHFNVLELQDKHLEFLVDKFIQTKKLILHCHRFFAPTNFIKSQRDLKVLELYVLVPESVFRFRMDNAMFQLEELSIYISMGGMDSAYYSESFLNFLRSQTKMKKLKLIGLLTTSLMDVILEMKSLETLHLTGALSAHLFGESHNLNLKKLTLHTEWENDVTPIQMLFERVPNLVELNCKILIEEKHLKIIASTLKKLEVLSVPSFGKTIKFRSKFESLKCLIVDHNVQLPTLMEEMLNFNDIRQKPLQLFSHSMPKTIMKRFADCFAELERLVIKQGCMSNITMLKYMQKLECLEMGGDELKTSLLEKIARNPQKLKILHIQENEQRNLHFFNTTNMSVYSRSEDYFSVDPLINSFDVGEKKSPYFIEIVTGSERSLLDRL